MAVTTDGTGLDRMMLRSLPIIAILALQAISALYLMSDILASVLGISYQPPTWQFVEYVQIGASLGLIAGLVLGARLLSLTMRQRREAEDKLRRASTAFMEMVQQRFDEWALSPAERDVALFAIKGQSVAEIAALRGTSEGTVKAQAAAVYRKAGVSGRHQLLSLFIEDLFDPAPLHASAGHLPADPALPETRATTADREAAP
ncbi:MAG: helix-turn-helix transcriptional regulator [Paracoccus sp. (in: a-proteobacteria)]